MNDFSPIRIIRFPPAAVVPELNFHNDKRKANRQRRAIKFLKRTNCLPVPKVKEFVIDALKLNDKIFQLMKAFLYMNIKPTRLILGHDEYEQLVAELDIHHRLSHQLHYYENGTPKFHGMTVELCPWMSGHIVLP